MLASSVTRNSMYKWLTPSITWVNAISLFLQCFPQAFLGHIKNINNQQWYKRLSQLQYQPGFGDHLRTLSYERHVLFSYKYDFVMIKHLVITNTHVFWFASGVLA